MFILDNSEQGDRQEFGSAYEAADALLAEVKRQWGNHADGDEDSDSEWLAEVARARGLLRAAGDGAHEVDEPIVFVLPNGEQLTLSEAGND